MTRTHPRHTGSAVPSGARFDDALRRLAGPDGQAPVSKLRACIRGAGDPGWVRFDTAHAS